MNFSAVNYYPQVRFKNGEKLLYNPVLKKTFVSLPEERVRLQYLDFLLHGGVWSKNRVGFEIPVQFQPGETKLRADLILYDDDMNPFALGECKAPGIKLDERTAVQAARYNKEVDAPWLFVVNGKSEFWFSNSGRIVKPGESPILLTSPVTNNARETEYWEERGFLSPETSRPVKERMLALLNFYWVGNNSINYLKMNPSFLPFNAEHFFNFHPIDEKTTLAFTLLDDGAGSTKILFTANRGRNNTGIAVVNPENNETELFLPSEKKTVSSVTSCSIDFGRLSRSDIENLPQKAMNFFD